jgi:hypothetical protein
MTQPPRIITTDTDPANPVNDYDPNQFPLGAALTVAYGSTENMFCTLGNLYRILGYLDPDDEGVPMVEQLDAMIDRYRVHVMAALPDQMHDLTLPSVDASDTDRMAWLMALHSAFGPTVTLTPAPSDNLKGDDAEPTALPGGPNG